jgi:hypothetical protein
MGVYVLHDGSIGLSEVSLSLSADALKAIQEVNM